MQEPRHRLDPVERCSYEVGLPYNDHKPSIYNCSTYSMHQACWLIGIYSELLAVLYISTIY